MGGLLLSCITIRLRSGRIHICRRRQLLRQRTLDAVKGVEEVEPMVGQLPAWVPTYIRRLKAVLRGDGCCRAVT